MMKFCFSGNVFYLCGTRLGISQGRTRDFGYGMEDGLKETIGWFGGIW